MSLTSALGNFLGKQAFTRALNEIVGSKVFGLGALTHTSELGAWVDVNRMDGYTYNEADGHWYTTPPSPDYGQFGWTGRASSDKESELSTARRIHDLGNKIERRKPMEPDLQRDLTSVWRQLQERETWEHFRDLIKGALDSEGDPTPQDWKDLQDLMNDTFSPFADPNFSAISTSCNRGYRIAREWRAPIDPLMLDLDGDGLELKRADGSVLFDHNADTIRTGTGWIGADDGILVRDLNGNGSIDSGRELFGIDTLNPPCRPWASRAWTRCAAGWRPCRQNRP
jgi:hypothetical protein